MTCTQNATPVALEGQHHHQRPAPEDPKVAHRRQDAIVSADLILETIFRIDHDTTHDAPPDDLSSLTTHLDDMCLSLSLSTEQDSIPQAAPFLDPEPFETHFTKSRFNLSPTIMPEALPLGMRPRDDAAQPALYYGCLFFAAYERFSRGISQFFWDHIGEIEANNSDLHFGEDSLAPMLTKFVFIHYLLLYLNCFTNYPVL